MSSSQVFTNTSLREKVLFGSNVLANFAGIIGVGVWASAGGGWWGLSSAYGFYWFSVITSFLLGSFGLSFYGCKWVRDKTEFFPEFTNVWWVVVEAVYAIFMLSAGASVAQEASGCTALKNAYYNAGVPAKYCDGMIVAAVFGFVSFALWTTLAVFTSMDLYKQHRVDAPEVPPANSPVQPPTPSTTPIVTTDVENPAT
jgi:hypothetical protein